MVLLSYLKIKSFNSSYQCHSAKNRGSYLCHFAKRAKKYPFNTRYRYKKGRKTKIQRIKQLDCRKLPSTGRYMLLLAGSVFRYNQTSWSGICHPRTTAGRSPGSQSGAHCRLPDYSVTYWQSAPAYSDEIAQAFHLFPYSPQSPAAPTVFIQFSDKSAATIIAPSLSDGNHFLAAEKTAEIIVFYFSSAK